MKTNIKMKVTPKQSKDIQCICFANNLGKETELRLDFIDLDAPYLFINKREISYTHNTVFYNKQKEEEVDADLFIRTNGTCVEDKKEIDLRNTWCYATVPNHDKLRLMGYDHEPVGACKKYYYIDNDNKINDFEYHPDGNQIKLNNQGEFEYATLSSQQGKSECQFTKYGFENHKDCVILTKVGSWLIGYVKNGTQAPKPAMWFEYDGSSSATSETIPNLTPIKKPWYETCTFPCIIMADYCMPVVVKHYNEGFVYDFRDNRYCVKSWRLLTNDEIEGLKQ